MYTDDDGHIPSAVARRMLLNSCSRNPEESVPEWFNLPHSTIPEKVEIARGAKAMQSALHSSSCCKIKMGFWNPLALCHLGDKSVATKGPRAIADVG